MNNRKREDNLLEIIRARHRIPARFEEFLHLKPDYISVEWNNLSSFSLKRSATRQTVPFIRLGAGDVVAFWYRDVEPAIVYFGSEGELKVIAKDFDDFLRGLAACCSGVPEFDDIESLSDEDDIEMEKPCRLPGLEGLPDAKALPGLQQEFNEWVKAHSALLPPLEIPQSEALRSRIVAKVLKMLEDGLLRQASTDFPRNVPEELRGLIEKINQRPILEMFWNMIFQIENMPGALTVSYQCFGEWKPVPPHYGFEAEVLELLSLAKNPKLKRYELSVYRPGGVSLNQDKQLVLAAPQGLI